MYHLETKIESQGENITLNDTAEARFKKFGIGGNSWHKTGDVTDEEGNVIGTMPSVEFSSPIQNTGTNINILNKNNILSRNGVKTEILETGIRIIDNSQSKYEFIGIPLGGKELLGKNITCYSDVFENKNIYSNAELFFRKCFCSDIWGGNTKTDCIIFNNMEYPF